MGAKGSKPEVEVSEGETSFFAPRENPVQFSESLVNHLANQSMPSSTVPTSRQETLDSHIQSRINSELSRLREQEASVRKEIESALEKENLDKEKGDDSSSPSSSSSSGKGLSHSVSLMKDLKELEKRTFGLREEAKKSKSSQGWGIVETRRQELIACFRSNQSKPLQCREETEKFKAAVADIENAFIGTVH